MVVAVRSVWVVKVAIDDVIDVTVVGNRLVAAAGPVQVLCRVTGACVLRRASSGILGADVECAQLAAAASAV